MLPTPAKDKLLLKLIHDKTTQGLIIPESSKSPYKKAQIIISNSDLYKNGITILYEKHAGIEINLDNDSYILINDKNVLATFPEE